VTRKADRKKEREEKQKGEGEEEESGVPSRRRCGCASGRFGGKVDCVRISLCGDRLLRARIWL
jgi:hypothetical protein